jgi:hypothetical protein
MVGYFWRNASRLREDAVCGRLPLVQFCGNLSSHPKPRQEARLWQTEVLLGAAVEAMQWTQIKYILT